MDNVNKTFELSELDDKFWGKVIFVENHRSSGLGGPGALCIVTSEIKLYVIGFEAFPYGENRLEDFAPFFQKREYDRSIGRSPYIIEEKGWKYLYNTADILIKEEYYKEFLELCDKMLKRGQFLFPTEVFLYKIIKLQGEAERYNEQKLAKIIESNNSHSNGGK